MPPIRPYAFRSFDRQYLIADGRLISRPRPTLWSSHSERQVYLTTLICNPLGGGPATTACGNIPDMHHFRGSYGAKETMPLWRDAASTAANVSPGLLNVLQQALDMQVTPEDLFAYVYGILAQPAYTEHFQKELGTRELRVPITRKPALFSEVVAVGRRLIWLHTYGERFKPGKHALPSGSTKCTRAVSDQPDEYPEKFYYDPASETLSVGTGQFRPVAPDIWNFEVSGLQVVSSWLGYRMKRRQGKQSSPLDKIHPKAWTAEFTTELLHLLWIIEATLAGYPKQQQLFEQVIDGPVFCGFELPPVPNSAREAPGDDISEADQHELDY